MQRASRLLIFRHPRASLFSDELVKYIENPTERSVGFLPFYTDGYWSSHINRRGELCSPVGDRRSPLRLLIVYVRKFSPFFLAKLPQKEPKTARRGFAPAGATWGSAPSPRKLLKKFDQNFREGLVRVDYSTAAAIIPLIFSRIARMESAQVAHLSKRISPKISSAAAITASLP